LYSCWGLYLAKEQYTPKFGETFIVTDVEGRTHILFHKGNIEADSHGCILIGEQFEFINGIPAVLSSKKGFQEFMSLTRNVNEFDLSIHNLFY